MKKTIIRLLMACSLALAAAIILAQGEADANAIANAQARISPQQQLYARALRDPRSTNVYLSDLHLHTNLSTGAYLQGTVAVSPEDAFRFARGETILADSGQQVRLRRPLDFLAVTDHAEYLGL